MRLRNKLGLLITFDLVIGAIAMAMGVVGVLVGMFLAFSH